MTNQARENAAKKKEEMPFIEIFVNRSHPHLAGVITAYGQRHKSLSKVIKRTLYVSFLTGYRPRTNFYVSALAI